MIASQGSVRGRLDWIKIAAFIAPALAMLSAVARADDYGPHPALREIRHTLPVLLSSRLGALHITTPVVVSDVVVDGNNAVAFWHAESREGLVTLALHPNGWWMTAEANHTGQGGWDIAHPGSLETCEPAESDIGPTSQWLAKSMSLPTNFVKLAALHIRMVASADAQFAAYRTAHPNSLIKAPIETTCYTVGRQPAFVAEQDGYYAALWLSAPRASNPILPADFNVLGRAPMLTEMAPTPNADAIYFFKIESPNDTVSFAASRLDVWCPFVLDPSLRYSITIARSNPFVGPIVATLSDNTLHFTLPPFTAPTGTEVEAEIDGDPQ